MTKLTLSFVRTELAAIGYTIKRTEWDEYRVNVKGGHEDIAYYTDCLDDALSTAQFEAKRDG